MKFTKIFFIININKIIYTYIYILYTIPFDYENLMPEFNSRPEYTISTNKITT